MAKRRQNLNSATSRESELPNDSPATAPVHTHLTSISIHGTIDSAGRAQVRAEISSVPIQQGRNPFSLLITDDDDSFRESLRGIFESEGFRTLQAHSGEEALDILHDQPVHLALLDQHMPRLTGLETLRIIRQMNAILPVILLTADRTQQLMQDALSAQAFCVMSKPVSRNVVVYTVQRALARSYTLSTGPNPLDFQNTI